MVMRCPYNWNLMSECRFAQARPIGIAAMCELNS